MGRARPGPGAGAGSAPTLTAGYQSWGAAGKAPEVLAPFRALCHISSSNQPADPANPTRPCGQCCGSLVDRHRPGLGGVERWGTGLSTAGPQDSGPTPPSLGPALGLSLLSRCHRALRGTLGEPGTRTCCWTGGQRCASLHREESPPPSEMGPRQVVGWQWPGYSQ